MEKNETPIDFDTNINTAPTSPCVINIHEQINEAHTIFHPDQHHICCQLPNRETPINPTWLSRITRKRQPFISQSRGAFQAFTSPKMFPKPVEQYFSILAQQRNIYRDRCIVLMQVGSFFEVYGVPPAEDSHAIRVCTDILGFLAASKGTPGTPSHHLMAGFPVFNVRRNLKLLLEHNYTVIFVEQVGEVPNITREITRTVSPGLNLSEDVHETTDMGQSVLLSVMLEEDRYGDCYAHLCTFDSNRGTVRLETLTSEHAADLTQRIDLHRILGSLRDAIQTVEYHELCVYTRGCREEFREGTKRFVEQMQRQDKLVHLFPMHITSSSSNSSNSSNSSKDQCWFNQTVQAEQLQKFYPKYASGFCTIWERLGMLRTDRSCVALLVRTLAFVHDHDPRLVLDLNPPVSHQDGVVQQQQQEKTHNASDRNDGWGECVQCFNGLYSALDIREARTGLVATAAADVQGTLAASRMHLNMSGKMTSVFALINNTRTVMGRQLLLERLMHVSVSPHEMESRWDMVSALVEQSEGSLVLNELHQVLHRHLRSVDLERMYRRFRLGELNPSELPRVVSSQQNLLQIVQHVMDSVPPEHPFRKVLPDAALHHRLKSYQSNLTQLFELDLCAHTSFQTIQTSMFRKGRFPDVDEACSVFEKLTGMVDTMAQNLMNAASDVVQTRSKTKTSTKASLSAPATHQQDATNTWIKVKCSDRDGYWLELTRQRCEALRKRIEETPALQREFLHRKQLQFDCSKKSVARITCPALRNLSADIQQAQDNVIRLVKGTYTKTLQHLYKEHYEQTIRPLQHAVSQYDVAFSSATAASTFGYVRPTIDHNTHAKKQARLDIRALRHPLIERLLTVSGSKVAYVPNDVRLSSEEGWLLHGVNSAGKSSLLKGAAVAVLMAQAGMFVAAASMHFSPYTKIFSRTGNTDNLHRGQSSFVKEMSESQTIANCADARSLVIADELCASTERLSAVCIVSALLKLLSKRGASFVFATHLFDLQSHHYVQSLLHSSPHPNQGRLRNFFLDVSFDRTRKTFVFHRTLQSGLPANRQYGAAIAENVIANAEFSALLKGATQKKYLHKTGHYSPAQQLNGEPNGEPAVLDVHDSTTSPCGSSANRTHSTNLITPPPSPTPSATADDITSQLQNMCIGSPETSTATPYVASKYNAKVLMDECQVCQYRPPTTAHVPMDTHHIHEQQHAHKQTGLIQHRFHKNERHNLVPLCKPCHRMIDTGELVVAGYVMTSAGPKLQYSVHPLPSKVAVSSSVGSSICAHTTSSLPCPPAPLPLTNMEEITTDVAGPKKPPKQSKYTPQMIAKIQEAHKANHYKTHTTKTAQWQHTRDALGIRVGYSSFWKYVELGTPQDESSSTSSIAALE